MPAIYSSQRIGGAAVFAAMTGSGAGEVTAAVAGAGAVTYTGTGAVADSIASGAVAATGTVTYTGTAAVVASVIDTPPQSTARSAGPTIEEQPEPSLVAEGSLASFSVLATGTGGLTYEWLLDGVVYPGANSSALTFLATLLHDGVQVSVRVSDASGATTSLAVPLTVTEEAGEPNAAEYRQMFRWVSELASLHGLMPGQPLQVAQARRRAGLLEQSISTAGSTTTVTRL